MQWLIFLPLLGRRELAPHLRSLMGAWWVSQFDSSREVAEAAQNSFQVAFSGQRKRLEALVFCVNEIFTYLGENFQQTPQTISDKATPIEEATEKYERVVSSSLLALAALIDVLVVPARGEPTVRSNSSLQDIASQGIESYAKATESVTEAAVKLCLNYKCFKDFLKSRSSRIRSAGYQALRAFIQHIPQVFKDNLDMGPLLILGVFSEKESACHQPMWDMVLLFAKNFPKAWTANIVRKAVFPKLWDFLRHGCYGSPRISYPCLQPLISMIPPEAVIPSKGFFLELFSSLWHGLATGQLSSADGSALLSSLQECLLYAVNNARRYTDMEGYSSVQLQDFLTNVVLLRFLWCDYVQIPANTLLEPGSSDMSDGSNKTDGLKVDDENLSNKNHLEKGRDFVQITTLSAVLSEKLSEQLVHCIVNSIQSFSGHDMRLLDAFWAEFHHLCFEVMQEAGQGWQQRQQEDNRVARIAEFFNVLGSYKHDQNGIQRQWPLTQAVSPFVAKSFFVIKSMGHPESVRILAKLTSMFGPAAFSQLSHSAPNTVCTVREHQRFSQAVWHKQEENNTQDMELVLQFFKEELIPWCLDGNDDLNIPKVEVILAFLENDRFCGEWESVVSHVTGWQHKPEKKPNLQQVAVLASLLEKIRVGRESTLDQDSVKQWQCQALDSATLAVASSCYLSDPACHHLLRSALGVKYAEKDLAILSDQAAALVLRSLLKLVASVIAVSQSHWARSAASLVCNQGDTRCHLENNITADLLDLSATAVEVICDCSFSLLYLDKEFQVGGHLLAAPFCLSWAISRSRSTNFSYLQGNHACQEDDSGPETEYELSADEASSIASDQVPGGKNGSDLGLDNMEQKWIILRGALKKFRHRVAPLYKEFSATTRCSLRDILFECVKLAVFDEESEETHQRVKRCAVWAREVVESLCDGFEETQRAVEKLVGPDGGWPVWVEATSPVIRPGTISQQQSKVLRHAQFVAFVDALSFSLGSDTLFLGTPLRNTRSQHMSDIVEGSSVEAGNLDRAWLVVELLCTQKWPGGSAKQSVLPFLWSLSLTQENKFQYTFLQRVICSLLAGCSSNWRNLNDQTPTVAWEDIRQTQTEPFLQGLLDLLHGLFDKADRWGKSEAQDLFINFVVKQDTPHCLSPICDMAILPHVLSVLMPVLRKRTSGVDPEDDWKPLFQKVVDKWLREAMTGPPLVACGTGDTSADSNQWMWMQVAIACFPLNVAGGVAAMVSASAAQVTQQEREQLYALLLKQYSREALAAVAAHAALQRSSIGMQVSEGSKSVYELTLAKLMASTIGYCWVDFDEAAWHFILGRLRNWLAEAVVSAEDFTEAVVDIMKGTTDASDDHKKSPDAIVRELEDIAAIKLNSSVELYSTAVTIFSLVRGLYNNLDGAVGTQSISSLESANWKGLEIRILEDILRILLAVGLAESAAHNSAAGVKAGNVIGMWIRTQIHFWDNVADVALSTSSQAREAAIRSVDMWGVGNGAISALYALLFSTQPTMSLQWVAYQFLCTDRIQPMAVTHGVVGLEDGECNDEEKGGGPQDLSPAVLASIRPDLASVLEMLSSLLLHSHLTSCSRVCYMLGWALFLTRVQALPACSTARERLVQYAQDSDTTSTLLDCLFQHIPLEHTAGTSGSRKRNLAASKQVSNAVALATRAIATGSVAFAVEGLWPVTEEGLLNLAGAIYGLVLLVLPACVRIWFTSLRDRNLASAVEAFTTAHYSPQLLADEFSQVQASAVSEENLSIKANRTMREVTAIYMKEEAGMDIVIRLPACYPLRAVEVECTRRMGISETLLRKWILSMASFLRHQNGAVAEAVQMWKRNVDREFEGVEECPICYSIIHTSNHSLPRLACKTCRHKFHKACLYKWFSTSHQSTCPLCKTPF